VGGEVTSAPLLVEPPSLITNPEVSNVVVVVVVFVSLPLLP